MSYVIHQRDAITGKSRGYIKTAYDSRKAVTTHTRAAAQQIADAWSGGQPITCEVLHYDDAFGMTSSDDSIIHA